jgi:hypothetical protein
MKIKVIRVVNSVPILKEMADTKFKVSTTYKIRKIIDECNIISMAFEKQRLELLEKYATLNKAKTEYKFNTKKPGDLDAYNEEMSGVTEDEVEISIPLLALAEIDSFDIEPSRIGIIDWFLEEVA